MTLTVFSVATLAEHWGCGTDTIYALIHGGELASFKLGDRLFRVRADEVERFEREGGVGTEPAPVAGVATNARLERLADATDIRLERLIERPPKSRT